MSKDTDPSVSKQVAGSLVEALGKLIGDAETQAEGTAKKKAAEAQRNATQDKARAKSAHKD